MADRREEILQRIEAVLRGVSGLTVKRMQTHLDKSDRPGLVINDGDEEVANNETRVNRTGKAKAIMGMRPVIGIYAVSADRAGTEINKYRAAVIKALVNDATLADLCTENGSIKYLGCKTGVQMEEAMAADMAAVFQLFYVFNPAAL